MGTLILAVGYLVQFLAFAIFMMFSRHGDVRLGPDGSVWHCELELEQGRMQVMDANEQFAAVAGDPGSDDARFSMAVYVPDVDATYRKALEEHPQDSDLKLRLSYGVTGSQAVSQYQSLARLSTAVEVTDRGAAEHHGAPVGLDELSVQRVANRALDRCAATGSTWTRHTVQEHVTRILTEAGVRATPTFFINGRLIEGNLPLGNFQQQIQEALES